MWLKLALLSAVSKALNQVATKVLLRHTGVLEISAYGQVTAALIMLPLIFTSLVNVPAHGGFHQAAWITILLNVLAIVLLTEAIRRSDLSYAIPFLSLTPVFAILTAWMIRGEQPNLIGIAGIVLVAVGALGIDAMSVRDWLRLGGSRVLRNRGVWLVVIVAFLYALSIVYDKTATLLSDPLTFVWYSAVVRAILLLLLLAAWHQLVRRPNHGKPAQPHRQRVLLYGFVALGITFVLEATFQMYALQTGLVAFVVAIKRLSVIITSIIGFWIFREAFTWFRILGAAIMGIGAAMIQLAA
jgi:drug/metabolite transporter (DMT)-like permease